MTCLIYQVGRFDQGMKKEYNFEIEGKDVYKQLSSFVLKECLKEKGLDARVILIYPVSLPFNKKLKKEELEDFYEKVEVVIRNPEEYLKDPTKFFSEMPYYKDADDFFVIHSIGEYAGVTFKGEFSDIVFEIAIDMIERYLKDEVERIYIDISTGFNIYVSAMLEAVRFFSTWASLRNWLPEEKRPEILLAFSDPILGNEATRYQIHLEKVEFKSFFSSPLSREDVKGEKVYKAIYKGDDAKKERLKKLFENFAIIFAAINRNAPLAVYHFGFDDVHIIRKTFEVLMEDMKSLLYKSHVNSPGLKKEAYSKAILTLGFYEGIVKVLNKYGVKKYEREDGINIEEIKNTFSQIYILFGLDLNRVFLGNEVGNTKVKIKNEVDDGKEWQLLIKIHRLGEKIGLPDKRNYFAHSGLEGLVTEFRKESGKIFVRYAEKYVDSGGNQKSVSDLIKRWLIEEI